MQVFRIFFVLSLLVSCSSSDEHSSRDSFEIAKSSRLAKGISYIDNDKPQEAHDFFERFLERNPVSPFTAAAMYYDGIALNELGRFSEAVSKLSAVVKLTLEQDRFLEAEALYQLGKSYEGLGQDPQALATWLDADRRSKYLSVEVAEVEVPAKIAGTYARQGLLDLADKYYSRADKGLVKLKGNQNIGRQEWIPRSLFGMGKISPRDLSKSDFSSGLKSMRRSQSYLLRAVEFGHPQWSSKAAQEIEYIYNSAWKVIENYPVEESEDKLAALKLQQDKLIELGLILNGSLTQLQQEFIPGEEGSNEYLKKTKQFLDSFDRKLDALIASRPINEGLTPEAQKLEDIMRGGRVTDPSGNLEKKLPNKKVTK